MAHSVLYPEQYPRGYASPPTEGTQRILAVCREQALAPTALGTPHIAIADLPPPCDRYLSVLPFRT